MKVSMTAFLIWLLVFTGTTNGKAADTTSRMEGTVTIGGGPIAGATIRAVRQVACSGTDWTFRHCTNRGARCVQAD